jgi:outer membrane protein TolC
LWSGTLVNVQLNQPLFAYNRLKWDKKIEPLRYEESRRSYVEEMEFVSSTAVDRFFELLQAQVRLEIANFNLANTNTILKIEKNRYNIGTTTEDKVLQVELSYLNEQQNVAQAELDFESASLRLRSFIGLNEDVGIDLVLPDQIPQLVVDYMTALNYAKENRADYLAFERQRLEAEANVAEAKGNRFQVNFNASYGLNNRAGQYADIYVDPNSQQRANISFNVPILDWGRNKSRMAIATANMQLTEFTIAQELINFEQEIRTQVTQIDMLSNQIELAKKTDEVANARYTISQGRYLTGSTTILELNQALSDKDSKKLQYITSLRDYWRAYYDLRRLTLYDFANNRLLYNPTLNN